MISTLEWKTSLLKKVFDAVLSNKFKVEISKKYSLDEAQKAHEDLEARKLTGPAVILP